MENNCIFCKIVKGELPCVKIFEDENFLAFLDIMPAVLGHTLVIPKKHFENFNQIPQDLIGKYFIFTQKISKAVEKTFVAKGFKIENFNGVYAGQMILHAHNHIIPRFESDQIIFGKEHSWWIPQKQIYEKFSIEDIAKKIKENIENF